MKSLKPATVFRTQIQKHCLTHAHAQHPEFVTATCFSRAQNLKLGDILWRLEYYRSVHRRGTYTSVRNPLPNSKNCIPYPLPQLNQIRKILFLKHPLCQFFGHFPSPFLLLFLSHFSHMSLPLRYFFLQITPVETIPNPRKKIHVHPVSVARKFSIPRTKKTCLHTSLGLGT